MFRKLTISLILFMLTAVTPFAAEISGSAGIDFVSRYVWRGFNLSDGLNTQPGAELSMGGLTLGYWGSFNWEAKDINLEQDLYVSAELPQTKRVMVKDEDLCVHCGLCAERCPTGAWDMQKSKILIPYARDELSDAAESTEAWKD